jgi:hypothetical protein
MCVPNAVSTDMVVKITFVPSSVKVSGLSFLACEEYTEDRQPQRLLCAPNGIDLVS